MLKLPKVEFTRPTPPPAKKRSRRNKVFSFRKNEIKEFITVEEAIEKIFPLAAGYCQMNNISVNCLCSETIEMRAALIGENMVPVLLAKCKCGRVYYCVVD